MPESLFTLSRRSRLLIALIVLVTITGYLTSSGNEVAKGQESGYAFSDLVVKGVEDGHIVIGYEYEWTGDHFPGSIECAFSVLDDAGEVVAERSGQFYGMEPMGRDRESRISLPDSVAERPNVLDLDSARVECGNRRMDGVGTYEITNAEIVRSPESADDQRTLSLSFHDEWRGGGIPGVAECMAKVYAENGQLILEYPFSFEDAMGSSDISMRIFAPDDVTVEPAAVEVDCQPFTKPIDYTPSQS